MKKPKKLKMKGPEFEKALNALGLNQSSGADFLGINHRTSRRYIAEERAIPYHLAMLLRDMVSRKADPEVVTASPVVK